MSYKIVVDSCCDLPKEYISNEHISFVPLTLMVGDCTMVDDDTFDQKDFLKKVSECPTCPKSACPSPEVYEKEYDCDSKDVYVVTLSANLSGSYNSAAVGRDMYLENGGKNNVHVFDSKSASIGEALIAMEIIKQAESGKSFTEVVEAVEAYVEEMKTFFVLETLDTLKKNGRLSNIQAVLVSVLNIKPVMASDQEGRIQKLDQARGINKALAKMVEIIDARIPDKEKKVLGISHCNNYERALYVKNLIQEKCSFKDIVISDTKGVASLYAADGGIIISV